MRQKYKNLTLCFSLVFFVIALDQLLKLLFKHKPFDTAEFLGFSIVKPVKNIYFLFGFKVTGEYFFIHLALICITLVFCFYYFIFMFWTDSKKLKVLKLAVTFLLGAWLSNLIDKLHQGYVLDYIKWNVLDETLYFNLADLFQSLAWIFIIHQMVHLRHDILRYNERRRHWFVSHKLQYQFLAYFTLIFLIMAVFFILLIKQVLFVFGLSDISVIKEVGFAFLLGTLVGLAFLYFFIGLFFAYLSHKIYGPVYAFEKHIRECLKGQPERKNFRLRKGDQFKNLEKLASDIQKNLNQSDINKN